MIAFEIIVFGVVQGVAFRHFTRLEAERLDLFGTVQNYSDGSVCIFVEGEEDAVMQFLCWCHHGPDSASVESLEYSEQEPRGIQNFRILR